MAIFKQTDLVKGGHVLLTPRSGSNPAHLVINPEAAQQRPLRDMEAGRALRGYIRYVMGQVDPVTKLIPSTGGDESFLVGYDMVLERAVQYDLIPTMRGMRPQKRVDVKGQPVLDFGYVFNGQLVHQITSGAAALMAFHAEETGGMGFNCNLIPTTEKGQGNEEYVDFLITWANKPEAEQQAFWDAYIAVHNGAAVEAFA